LTSKNRLWRRIPGHNPPYPASRNATAPFMFHNVTTVTGAPAVLGITPLILQSWTRSEPPWRRGRITGRLAGDLRHFRTVSRGSSALGR
jgi:hypothetical protein